MIFFFFQGGVGTFLNGIFGSVTGATASVENAGILALTRVGIRRVVQITAVFMILFSLLASTGLGYLQFCNLNNFRTKFILGFSFSLGLSIPQYFRGHRLSCGYGPVHTYSTWFNDAVTVILMSHATVVVLVGLLLDRTLPRGDDDHGKDSGTHWWEQFVLFCITSNGWIRYFANFL